jgi:hypothetical protein
MSDGELDLDLGKICWIAERAREMDVRDEMTELEVEDDVEEDDFGRLPEGLEEDAVALEAKTLIEDLNRDQQCELVALAWLGRGDFTLAEWQDALALAQERHNDKTALYLLGMPQLSDYLESGLSEFGLSCRGLIS